MCLCFSTLALKVRQWDNTVVNTKGAQKCRVSSDLPFYTHKHFSFLIKVYHFLKQACAAGVWKVSQIQEKWANNFFFHKIFNRVQFFNSFIWSLYHHWIKSTIAMKRKYLLIYLPSKLLNAQDCWHSIYKERTG